MNLLCNDLPERNMTDKELLEAAARAAGMPAFASGATGLRVASDGCKSGYIWNPLTDDGDALRLVVELMLTITMRHHECEVFDEDGQFLASESLHCPPDARQELVRRAIVRAAAALDSGHNAAAVPP